MAASMSEHEYELLERIGIGGMAEVYRANSLGAEGFERPIAIKRILPNLAEDEDFVKMFIDEAKIAVQLSHPNIVGIFDLGRLGEDYFIAMELVHGRDLRQVQDREAQLGRRVPLEIALHATMKICEALHHAHFKGGSGMEGDKVFIIHRDVSPQNVLMSFDGQVKVTDFGLAKAAGRAVQTQAGIIKGKLAYMSPEQLTAVPIDQRSDVFAAGTLLWELLTGERLFLGQNDRETIQNVYLTKVTPPAQLDPAIPPELDAIVMRALAKNRDERYRTAQQLHDDLEEFAYGANAMIGAPSVSAYMRALFPEIEVSQPRKRDPRAATAQIRVAEPSSKGKPPRPAYDEVDDAEPLDELDEELDGAELSDADVEAEPDSAQEDVAPAEEPALAADDVEESRKTVPPVGPMDYESYSEAVSSVGAGVSGVAASPSMPEPGMHDTGVLPPPQESGARLAPLPERTPETDPNAFDDYQDRTVFGDPPGVPGDDAVGNATHEFTGDPRAYFEQVARAQQLDQLEPAVLTTDASRLPPEELLTTKAHAPSDDLLARARRERAAQQAAAEAEGPRDTQPPPQGFLDDFDDEPATMVGNLAQLGAVAPPVVSPPRPAPGPGDWEDETTPVGGRPPRQKAR
jgi:serine/threonine protein kinase